MKLPNARTLSVLACTAAVLTLSSCSRTSAPAVTSPDSAPPRDAAPVANLALPDPSDLAALSGSEALALANAWRTTYPAIGTQLTSDAVLFHYPDGRSYSVDLDGDDMVLAIAPWVTYTHPCEIHSISGCRGELPDEEFHVRVTAAGTTYLDQQVISMDSGFFEIALPRGMQYSIEIRGLGRTVTGEVSTGAGSPTCLTNFQLRA